MSDNRLTRFAGMAVTGLLIAGGGSALGWAGTHQAHAPQPAASAAGVVDPPAGPPSAGSAPATTEGGAIPAPTPSRRPPPTTTRGGADGAAPATAPVGPVLARSLPTSIRIPSIGVDSSLLHLGERPDGTLQVPPLDGSPQTDMAAWYDGSVTPGQLGPSVILGHVDSAADGPSVFFRLGALRPGDRVEISRADGSVVTFTVSAVRRYAKDAFPTALVYGNTDDAALRLVTCGGTFDAATGHYRDNVVVFAHLTGTSRTGTRR